MTRIFKRACIILMEPKRWRSRANRVDGVFSRGDYQNTILCALHKKLTSPQVVTQIPDLINAFQNSVQTDLSPQIMEQLACLGTQLPRENIAMYNFPENLFTGSQDL